MAVVKKIDWYKTDEYIIKKEIPEAELLKYKEMLKEKLEDQAKESFIKQIQNEYTYKEEYEVRTPTLEEQIADLRNSIRAVELSNRELTTNLANREEAEVHEQRLRMMHPGLNELWEQYQAMLKLVNVS